VAATPYTYDALIKSLVIEGWELTHIINLGHCWQVNYCNGEFVVVGTGDIIDTAITSANNKTLDLSQYSGRLFSLGRLKDITEPSSSAEVGRSLLSRLGLAKPKAPFVRRI